MASEDNATLAQILKTTQQTMQAMQKLLTTYDQRLSKVETKQETEETSIIIPSNTRLIGDLEKRLPEFSFNPDTDIAFSDWYARYEHIFITDGAQLDDKSRLRLLTEKLAPETYRRFASHVLPKAPNELKFNEAVKVLKNLFEIPISVFKRQYDCWSSSFDKDPLEDDQTYADRINERFYKVMNKMDVEDLKVLRFLVGLKGKDDQIHLPYLLSYADKTKEAEEALTLQGIVKELTKQRTFKRDGQLVAKSQQINQIQRSGNKNRTHNARNNSNGYQKGKGQYNSENKNKNTVRCTYCSKKGHVIEECYRKNPQLAPKKYNNRNPSQRSHSYVRNVTEKSIENSNANRIHVVRRFTDVIINNTPLVLQADTGSDVTILDIESWQKIGEPELKMTDKRFTTANNTNLICKGKLECKFCLNGQNLEGDAYVVQNGTNLLGLEWMQKSRKHQKALDMIGYPIKIQSVTKKEPIDEILLQKYPEIFERGLGTCTKEKAHLQLKRNAVPVFCPPRKVPYAAQEAVENEIDRLLKLGVIKPITYSQWSAPIVTAKKANGKIRVCVDFSTGLNGNLEDNAHPLPIPEDIFAHLNGGTIFSQIDLSDAYLQIELDEYSQKLVVINTHRGLFQYTRLPFGIKTAPAIFQSLMTKMTAGLPGVASYLDDLLITGKTRVEHDENLLALFNRINEYGFRLQIEKCAFHKEEIKFLGYMIDKNGRRPDPDKISALINMQKPENVAQLKSFLGLVSYYGQFLPSVKQLRGPLDKLTHKEEKWVWSDKCDIAFEKLIKVLSSDLNLCHYNPELPVIVSADACEYGTGGVISHRFPDGKIKPIHHCSKALTVAERNYSQIEKEGLALITAIKKFHKYLYGRKFILQTDHKPLLKIYGSKNGLPTHMANRLIRWGTILLGYDFDIAYVNTDSFGQADGLSRLMSTAKPSNEEIIIALVEQEVNANFEDSIRKLPLLAKTIAKITEKDSILSTIYDSIISNKWQLPKLKKEMDLRPFYDKRDELSIVQKCILYGDRVIIPEVLRFCVLKELHKGHPGIVRMKKLAQSYVYWPGVDKDIENYVKRCENCQMSAKIDRKIPLNPWPTPERVWQRVHADYAGPVDGLYYLVVVDSLSRWPEVLVTRSISAIATVKLLESVFAQNGNPECLVTDNGTQFTSKEFAKLCQENGINHIFSPPYHPQSNGRAERFVDTLKRGLQKLKREGGSTPPETVLNKFLLAYRTTPCSVIENRMPSEVFMGRKLRTTLSLMIPRKDPPPQEKSTEMKEHFDRRNGVCEKNFVIGELVYYKKFQGNNWIWIPATISQVRGRANYSVQVHGKEHHAHANHLRKRLDSSPSETKTDDWYDTMMHTFHLSPQRKSTTREPPTSSTVEPIEPVDPKKSQENLPEPAVPDQEQDQELRQEDELAPPAVQPSRAPELIRRSNRTRKAPQRFGYDS